MDGSQSQLREMMNSEVKTDRSSFGSSFGNDDNYYLISNYGDGYDSDSSNFAPPSVFYFIYFPLLLLCLLVNLDLFDLCLFFIVTARRQRYPVLFQQSLLALFH